MRIYTPAHGAYPDTLIMYGISKAALYAGTLLCVKGLGSYYEIEVGDLNILASNLAHLINTEGSTIMDEIAKFTQSRERKKLEEALEYLSDTNRCLQFLNSLTIVGHANSEGRGKEGKSVPLAFIPFAGKYRMGEFKCKEELYKLCSGCLGLLSYGFFNGTIRTQQQLFLIATTVAFEGTVDSNCLRMVLGALGCSEVGKRELKVPLRTLTYIRMSKLGRDVIASLNEANASWKAITTRFVKEKGVLQVRGIHELTLDPILDALSRMRGDDFDTFNKLVENLVKAENSAALVYLFDYLSKRDLDLLAMASRSIYQSFPMGERLVKILATI
ncbi:MAG: hypothetical protein QXS32_08735 [Candidatus Nezhaarchaeales archaeon]